MTATALTAGLTLEGIPTNQIFLIQSPNGTYLKFCWEGDKVVVSGDAKLDESAQMFFDHLKQLISQHLE